MGQQNEQNYHDKTSGNPPQGNATVRGVGKESDEAYFAREREGRDPKAPENMNSENAPSNDVHDLDTDTLGPDAARNLGGGRGDFRSMQDTEPDDRQESWKE
jgi:hypothetical protein